MRRKDREITGLEEKLAVIGECRVCRLALVEEGRPYIVPLNYGWSFENGVLALYFHSANEGKKLDIIRGGCTGGACFEVDCGGALIEGEKPCAFGYAYRSVIGFGKLRLLETDAEKSGGLNLIMKHQTGRDAAYHYAPEELAAVTVFCLTVEEFTGKERKPPFPG